MRLMSTGELFKVCKYEKNYFVQYKPFNEVRKHNEDDEGIILQVRVSPLLLLPSQYSFGLPGVGRSRAPSSVWPQRCTGLTQQTAQTEE